MKKALIHDWLVVSAGAEKCVQSFTNIWDDFDIFSLIDFLNDSDRQNLLKGKFANTTFIQKLPFAKTKYRNYLPLFPFAVEQHDLTAYDVILSTSHAVAKGVLTHSDQLHVCYICTPVRYAWDLYHQYLNESGLNRGIKGLIAKYFLHKLRQWDVVSSNRVDHFVAISHFIARRVKKVYGREADVIYPPVDVEKFVLKENKEDFYLTASRMVPYKKIDLIVEAFSQTNKKLVVIGTGPDMKKIKEKAGKNIELLGFQSDELLLDYMQRTKAFVFAAEEDFGIIPVEAQACGTPVICLGRGGTQETVIDGTTGIHFQKQTVQDLLEAIEKFEKIQGSFAPLTVRKNALRFCRKRFEKEIKEFVETKYRLFEEKGIKRS